MTATVPWGRDDIGYTKLGGVTVLRFVGSVTAKRDVPIRQTATTESPIIATMKEGETAIIRGTFRNESHVWGLIEHGENVGRALLSAFRATGSQDNWPVP